MKKILISTSLFLFANFCFAGIFGPSSFEECMNDGKIGRNTYEVKIHKDSCGKKFPKLLNVKNGKNTKITCVFDDMVGGIQFELNLKNRTGTGGSGKKFNLKIISITDEFVDFSVVGEKDEGRLNLLSGNLFFEFVDEKGNSSNHSLNCSEIK